MKLLALSLTIFSIICATLAQINKPMYLNSASNSPQQLGTIGQPYISLSQALSNIDIGEVNTIYVYPSPITYLLNTSYIFEDNTQIIFQIYTPQPYNPGKFLTSAASCSQLPVFEFQEIANLGAASLTFNGIAFVGTPAENSLNIMFLTIQGLNIFFFDTCQTLDFTDPNYGQITIQYTSSLGNTTNSNFTYSNAYFFMLNDSQFDLPMITVQTDSNIDGTFLYNLTLVNIFVSSQDILSAKFFYVYYGAQNVQIYNIQSAQLPKITIDCLSFFIQNVTFIGNSMLSNINPDSDIITVNYFTSLYFNNISIFNFNLTGTNSIFYAKKNSTQYLDPNLSPNINPNTLTANQNITITNVNFSQNILAGNGSFTSFNLMIADPSFSGFTNISNLTILLNNMQTTSAYLFSFLGLAQFQVSNILVQNNTNLMIITSQAVRTYQNILVSLTNLYLKYNYWNDLIPEIFEFDTNTDAPSDSENISTIISNITSIQNQYGGDLIDLVNSDFNPSPNNYYLRPRTLLTNVYSSGNNIVDAYIFWIDGFTLDFFDITTVQETYSSSNLLYSADFETPIQIQNLQVINVSLTNSILLFKEIDQSVQIRLVQDSNLLNIGIPFSFFVFNCTFQNIIANGSKLIETNGVPIFILTNSTFTNISLYMSNFIYPHDLFTSVSQVLMPISILSTYMDYLNTIQNPFLTISMQQSLNITGNLYQLGKSFSTNFFIYRAYNLTLSQINASLSNFIYSTNVQLNISGLAIDTISLVDFTLNLLSDNFISLEQLYKYRFWNTNLTLGQGEGTFMKITEVQYEYMKVINMFNNSGISFFDATVSTNYMAEFKELNVTSSSSYVTLIHFSAVLNAGLIRVLGCNFDNLNIFTSQDAYQAINLILFETQSCVLTPGVPSVQIYNNTFSNIIFFKNHFLIKQYINSLFVALLSQDILELMSTTFYNISILYDSNSIVLVSQTILLNGVNVTKTNNYDSIGAIYILGKQVAISNSIFSQNYAPNGVGGALYFDYDSLSTSSITLYLENNTFSNNVAKDGVSIFYSQRYFDFTAINNYFSGEMPTNYLGSFISLQNLTFSNFNMTNNTFYYPNALPNAIRFLSFISGLTSSPNVGINFINTNIILGDAFTGQIFYTTGDQTNVAFNLNNINIIDLDPTATQNHSMNIIFASSGIINLNNTVVTNLRPLTQSLIVTQCMGYNISLNLFNCSFNNLTVNQKYIVLNDSTYTPLGIIRLNGLGSSESCSENLLVQNVNFTYLNYNSSLFNNYLQRARVAVVPAASAIIIDYDGNFTLNVTNSIFSYIFGYRGAAINILNSMITNYTTFSIQSSSFTNLIAYYEGGAIYSLQNSTSIVRSNFTKVYSMKRNGPAIYCFNNINASGIVNKSNNTFNTTQGYAIYSFKTNYSLGTSPKALVPFFSPEKGSGIKVLLKNGSIYLHNLTSGALSQMNISLHLVDGLGQLVYDDYFIGSFSKSFSLNVQGKFIDTRACDYYGCIMIKPYLPLKGIAHQMINFTLSYKSLQEFSVPDLQFFGLFRPCMPGELNISQTGECYRCPIGSYSFNPSDIKCSKCPENVVCLGGDIMILNPGYWRENTSSSLIFKCNISGTCLGGYNSSCLTGYDGPLCSSCNAQLRWVSNNQICSQCPSSGVSLIYTILTTLVTMAYQVWFVKTVRTSNKMFGNHNMSEEEKKQIEMKVSQGIYVRLLTTYLQIFALISTFNINFSSLIKGLNDGSQIIANPSSTVFYSSLCSVLDAGADPDYLLYYKVTFTILLTPLKILIVCIYRLFFWRFKVTENRVSVLIITAVCIFMLDQPNVFKELVGFIACAQLDPNSAETFIVEDLQYSCSTESYNNFLNYMVIPAMLLYAVIVPGFYLIRLWAYRKKLDDRRLRLGYGALYNEYTEEVFYWGIILMMLKLVLMYMGSILYDDVKTKALSIFIILALYYILYVKLQPYKNIELYNAERLALVSYLVSIFGSIYYIDNTLVYMQWLTAIVVVALNLYAFYVIVKGMVLLNVIKITDILRPIIAKMVAKKEKEKKVQELRAMNVSDVVELTMMESKRGLVTETTDI